MAAAVVLGFCKVCWRSPKISETLNLVVRLNKNFSRTIKWRLRASAYEATGTTVHGYTDQTRRNSPGHWPAGHAWRSTKRRLSDSPLVVPQYIWQQQGLSCYMDLGRPTCGNNAFYSTKTPRDKYEDPAASQDRPVTTGSRLENTRQMIKETRGKMKDRVEEIIMRENIMTIPNMLCLTRIVLSPVIGYLILHNGYTLALGLFVFAGITDLLDGFIARNFKSQQSMFGSFLDPLADKLLVFTLVIALTGCNLIPVPLTALIIARDACLIGAGFYIRYVSLPPPKTVSRYFNATLATAQLQPTFVSKVNTAVQLSLVAVTLASPIFGFVDHECVRALWYITATSTVVSALSYVLTKSTYLTLKKMKDDKK